MLAHLARHAGRSVAGRPVRVGFVADGAGLLVVRLVGGGGSSQRRRHYDSVLLQVCNPVLQPIFAGPFRRPISQTYFERRYFEGAEFFFWRPMTGMSSAGIALPPIASHHHGRKHAWARAGPGRARAGPARLGRRVGRRQVRCAVAPQVCAAAWLRDERGRLHGIAHRHRRQELPHGRTSPHGRGQRGASELDVRRG
eukprot:scaffold58867_cov65-Phaeocystis_antarctica.AAC.4